jgi:hypothetical protein
MFSNPVRTPERPNSNKYNLEHSPAGSPSNHKVNPNPVRQNFNSLNKFGNDDRFNSQEYSQKFSIIKITKIYEKLNLPTVNVKATDYNPLKKGVVVDCLQVNLLDYCTSSVYCLV